MTGKRAQQRAQMEARILREGRTQLREVGAAQLSLRAVARSIGVASSAVYRYVSSRDELLTLLIVDAYTDLADAVDAALADAPTSPRERFALLARTMRRWALDHREQWTLLYGSPVPGYTAPAAETLEPGTRVMRRLLEIGAETDGDADPAPRGTPAFEKFAEEVRTQFRSTASTHRIAQLIPTWGMVVGVISSEIFGQMGEVPPQVGERILETALEQSSAVLGLDQERGGCLRGSAWDQPGSGSFADG